MIRRRFHCIDIWILGALRSNVQCALAPCNPVPSSTLTLPCNLLPPLPPCSPLTPDIQLQICNPLPRSMVQPCPSPSTQQHLPTISTLKIPPTDRSRPLPIQPSSHASSHPSHLAPKRPLPLVMHSGEWMDPCGIQHIFILIGCVQHPGQSSTVKVSVVQSEEDEGRGGAG